MTVHYDDFNAPLPKNKKDKVDADAALQNHPDTALTTVGDLLSKKPPESVQAAQDRLQHAPRGRLWDKLIEAQERRQRVTAWLINCEFTRRGLPPAHRPLQVNWDDAELLLDTLAVDLQWIGTRYPGHRVYFGRWKNFTNPRYLDRQARYIFNGSGRGKVPIYKVVKGLSLTVEQQRECHHLRTDRIRNVHNMLFRMLPEMKNEIEGRYMMALHRSRGAVVKLTAEDHAIVARRANVWLCANLSDWSPTRTAALYNVVTGATEDHSSVKPITRQQAANVMEQIGRDLPKKQARPC